jgi:hypothetical protein
MLAFVARWPKGRKGVFPKSAVKALQNRLATPHSAPSTATGAVPCAPARFLRTTPLRNRARPAFDLAMQGNDPHPGESDRGVDVARRVVGATANYASSRLNQIPSARVMPADP